MLFSIGTKVRLIHTDDVGVVHDWLEHDLIAVRLSDGDVIPVRQDALERISTEKTASVKAKIVPGKKKPEPLPIQLSTADSQYMVLKPQGLQLAFDPVLRADDTPEHYRIFLINDTQHHFLYQLTLNLAKEKVWMTQWRLGPRSMVEAGSLKYAELNDNAAVHLESWRLLPDGKGTGRRLLKEVKLRPTQFFNKITTAPYLNRPVYLYQLFSEKELTAQPAPVKPVPPPESLQAYTSRKGKTATKSWFNLQELPHEVWEMATFANEIDLHIEKIVADPAKVPANQILSTQLKAFDAYLERAIRLGVDRVFIIHGLGAGTLKEKIAERLRASPDVVSFTNEYHHRYGYGATEVIF